MDALSKFRDLCFVLFSFFFFLLLAVIYVFRSMIRSYKRNLKSWRVVTDKPDLLFPRLFVLHWCIDSYVTHHLWTSCVVHNSARQHTAEGPIRFQCTSIHPNPDIQNPTIAQHHHSHHSHKQSVPPLRPARSSASSKVNHNKD